MDRKKLASLLLSATILFLFAGCSSSGNSEDSTTKTTVTDTKTVKQITEQEFLEIAVSNSLPVSYGDSGDVDGILRSLELCKYYSKDGEKEFTIDYKYYIAKENAVAFYNHTIWTAEDKYYEYSYDNETKSFIYENKDDFAITNKIGNNYFYHTSQRKDEYYLAICCIENTVLTLNLYDLSAKNEAVSLFESLFE